jgi:hypothetical protein
MAGEQKRGSTHESDTGSGDRRRASAKSDEYRFADNLPDGGGTVAEREYENYVLAERDSDSEQPDVLLDVPVVKVDEITFEVEEVQARVLLQAEVLDLLKLKVGADVFIGRVGLEIKGVEAQALLKVRLDNVARIVDRVLTTVDRNPRILENITAGVGSAVEDVGGGARKAVGELGEGAGSAVEDVGKGAGSAVEDVGEGAGSAVEDVGKGAGSAVEDVGEGAGSAVEDVGEGAGEAVESAGEAVEDVGKGAGSAVEDVGKGAGDAVEDVGKGAGSAVEDVGEGAGPAVEATGETARKAGQGAGKSAGGAGKTAGKAASRSGETARKTSRTAQKPQKQGVGRQRSRTSGSQGAKQLSGRQRGSERRSQKS